ncbi:MAG: UbiA family prenyltransferase [Candidatus Woesearchaeota archaeon]|nr:UbiA family prenyltransferase [Candidatus Woesearchaeota archaeon]
MSLGIIKLIRLSRPVFWPVSVIAFLAGFFYSGAQFSYTAFFQMLMMSFPLAFITFGINDVHDYSTDKKNNRKTFLLDKKDHKDVVFLVHICIVIFIIASLSTFNVFNIFASASLLFLVYFYSSPPLRFKEFPPFDSISNGMMALSAFLIGHSFSFSYPSEPKIYVAAACFMGMHAYTTIADHVPDKLAGQKTFSTAFGKRAAVAFSLACFLAAYFFGNYSPEINIFLLISASFISTTFFYPNEKFSEISAKIIFVLGILMALIHFIRNI